MPAQRRNARPTQHARDHVPPSRRSETIATPATVVCVLTPEMTEGPSYVDDTMIRQDITDGKDGLPLTLRFIVADAITVGVDPSASAGSGFGGD